jgi:hypothetical protein
MPQSITLTADPSTTTTAYAEFQLYFRSLFAIGRSFAFPCDEHGQVQMDRLSQRARDNYLFARAMVGRELQAPAIERAAPARRPDRDGALYPRQHASAWDARNTFTATAAPARG